MRKSLVQNVFCLLTRLTTFTCLKVQLKKSVVNISDDSCGRAVAFALLIDALEHPYLDIPFVTEMYGLYTHLGCTFRLGVNTELTCLVRLCGHIRNLQTKRLLWHFKQHHFIKYIVSFLLCMLKGSCLILSLITIMQETQK